MLKLYNTLKRQVEAFKPLDNRTVTLYLCGPTVYDRAHLGNARPTIIVDVLIRLLQLDYDVCYVRNITDIDDKIIDAARTRGITISELTETTTKWYHDDMDALGNARPTHEPRATDHIQDMIDLIVKLIDKGHAYVGDGHVLFDTSSHSHYGQLSNLNQDDILAGARVEVAPYKKNPQDFVLWKPSTADQPGWPTSWGVGRPGWHIECSAMSYKLLGDTFDIHAGGQDLIFPHHENELAQSTCAFGQGSFAQYWMHNGMLMVDGKKMSKSLGNFLIIPDLLQQVPGEVIRFAVLSTHYRQPLDYNTITTLSQAHTALAGLYHAIDQHDIYSNIYYNDAPLDNDVLLALDNDLNTPQAITCLYHLASKINKLKGMQKLMSQATLIKSANLMGLLTNPAQQFLQNLTGLTITIDEIDYIIAQRNQARHDKDYEQADNLRQKLIAQRIDLKDTLTSTHWYRF